MHPQQHPGSLPKGTQEPGLPTPRALYTVVSKSVEFKPSEFSRLTDVAWWENESHAKEKVTCPSDGDIRGRPAGRRHLTVLLSSRTASAWVPGSRTGAPTTPSSSTTVTALAGGKLSSCPSPSTGSGAPTCASSSDTAPVSGPLPAFL